MEPIPDDILVHFNAVMNNKSVPPELRDDYRKWLRYYLDFRVKYSPPAEKSEQVRLFIEKMRSKGKSGKDLHHAAYAVSLFFSLQNRNNRYEEVKAVSPSIAAVKTADVPHMSDHIDAARNAAGTPVRSSRTISTQKPGRKYNEWWAMERTPSPEWDEVIIEKLAGEIKQRHYSRKTLKAYADWSRKFQVFLKHKPPEFRRRAHDHSMR